MAKVISSGATMDADFLKRTVGEPLSEALTSLVVAQPPDPIEFIGEALLDYIERRKADTKRVNYAAEVAEEHALHLQQQEIVAKENLVEEAAVHAKAVVEEEVEAAIAKASCHDDVYTKVLNLVRERLAAAGVQLGRKVVLEGQEIIEYIAASEGQEDIVGRDLKGLKEGEEPEEDGPAEEGVTFDVWKKTELPPPPEPVFDEEGELIPDENEPELIPPEHLLIENVVRDPRVKFFGIPKLGAYLAVRITYDSWLQPGGISDAPPPAPEDAPADEEGQEEGEADPAEEAAGEAATDGEEKTPPVPASVYSKNEALAQLVLCADTIGQGRCFSAKDVLWAKAWAEKLKVAVEALESRMYDDDTSVLPLLRGDDPAALVAKATEGEEAAVEGALAAMDAEATEEDKDRASKAARYRIRVKAVEAVEGLVALMGKLHLAPQAGVIDVLERALLLVGKARSDLCDARGALDWVGKMRMAVSTELVPAILTFKVEDAASATLAAEAKEAVEPIDAESVKANNVPTSAILEWMMSAITEAEDAATAAAAAAAAAEAAAEAATLEAEAAAEVAAAAAEEAGEGGEED